MSQSRYHLENKIDKIPQVKQGLVAICALLIATKSKDLECDIQVENKQFHIEVSEVAHVKKESNYCPTYHNLINRCQNRRRIELFTASSLARQRRISNTTSSRLSSLSNISGLSGGRNSREKINRRVYNMTD